MRTYAYFSAKFAHYLPYVWSLIEDRPQTISIDLANRKGTSCVYPVYDKAKWHFDGCFSEGVPSSQAYVHGGFFFGWLVENHLILKGKIPQDSITRFNRREITGPQLFTLIDGILDEKSLTKAGNKFAREYFNIDTGQYLEDYELLLGANLKSLYQVKDTWSNYDIIATRISERFRAAETLQIVRQPIYVTDREVEAAIGV